MISRNRKKSGVEKGGCACHAMGINADALIAYYTDACRPKLIWAPLGCCVSLVIISLLLFSGSRSADVLVKSETETDRQIDKQRGDRQREETESQANK